MLLNPEGRPLIISEGCTKHSIGQVQQKTISAGIILPSSERSVIQSLLSSLREIAVAVRIQADDLRGVMPV